MTTRCYMDWVPDTQTRQYVAYAQIAGILGFLIYMILQIGGKVVGKLKLVAKLIVQIYKRKQFLTDVAFVFKEN